KNLNGRRSMRASLVNQVSAVALVAVATIGIAAASSSAQAGILFTFDTMGTGSNTVTGLNDSSVNTDITTYMNSVVSKTALGGHAAYTAQSLSDTTKGWEGETNYTGESRVVGLTVGTGKDLASTIPVCGGSAPAYACGPAGSVYQMLSNSVVPLTLGNT